jgi:hypothetical protein
MTQPAQISGHEWQWHTLNSIGEDCGHCSCGSALMTFLQWQAHFASVAQAAQPQEVPAEQQRNGLPDRHYLEALVRVGMESSDSHVRGYAAQTARDINYEFTPAQPASAAKPAEDGLEAHVKEVLALAWARFNEPLWKARADVGELLRTHQAALTKEIRTCPVHGKSKQFCTDCATQLEQQASEARERELRDKLERLAVQLRERAVQSREEAGRIRRTVYVATDAESNCMVRAELWDNLDAELRALLASHWPAQKEDAK